MTKKNELETKNEKTDKLQTRTILSFSLLSLSFSPGVRSPATPNGKKTKIKNKVNNQLDSKFKCPRARSRGRRPLKEEEDTGSLPLLPLPLLAPASWAPSSRSKRSPTGLVPSGVLDRRLPPRHSQSNSPFEAGGKFATKAARSCTAVVAVG